MVATPAGCTYLSPLASTAAAEDNALGLGSVVGGLEDSCRFAATAAAAVTGAAVMPGLTAAAAAVTVPTRTMIPSDVVPFESLERNGMKTEDGISIGEESMDRFGKRLMGGGKGRVVIDDPESAERIRQENRQRKKKWREANEDRNKDNDLRCRVTKRANKLFGTQPSERRSKWIEVEFRRRQMKRLEKEKKRTGDSDDASAGMHVDGAGGNTGMTIASEFLASVNPVEFSQTLAAHLHNNLALLQRQSISEDSSKPSADVNGFDLGSALAALTSNHQILESLISNLGLFYVETHSDDQE